MDISNSTNSTATSLSALVNTPQPQPQPPKTEKKPEELQSSSVVKLSAEAQQLNRAENQNVNTERSETKVKETAEPPGIQFMEGESKGGRVNTFA